MYELPTPQMISTPELIGITEDFKANGYDGRGTVVAVIDSGIQAEHEIMVLGDEGKAAAKYNEQKVEEKLAELKANKITLNIEYAIYDDLTVENVFKNDKFPFGFDYAGSGGWFSSGDLDPEVKNSDGEHGIHVSGIIAANGTEAVKQGKTLNTEEGIVFDGVAPEAQIFGFKVFSDKGSGASTSDIVGAIEDAVTLGANVMNLSLGSAAGFSYNLSSLDYNNAFDIARNAGVVVACAAGNDNRVGEGDQSSYYQDKGMSPFPLAANPDTAFVGSPSTAPNTMSVASFENATDVSDDGTLVVGDVEADYTDTNRSYTKDKKSLYQLIGTGEYDFVYVGMGRRPNDSTTDPDADDFKDIQDLEGKIALVDRGEINFSVKVNNCEKLGAVGVIICNTDDEILRLNLSDIKGNVPGVAISRTDGDKIKALADTEKMTFKEMSTIKENKTKDRMSEYSSWGCTPDLKIKPEITAPGGSIYSALYSETDNGYGLMSGTSMASPHIAGAAALVLQYVNATKEFENYTVVEKRDLVENILMSTAVIKDNPDISFPYSPRQQGAGLLNVNNATKTKVYLVNAQSGKAKVEIGDFVEDTFKITFNVVNASDTSKTYNLKSYVMTDGLDETNTFITYDAQKLNATATYNGASVSVNEEASNNTAQITVPSGKTEVTVEFKLDKAQLDELSQYFVNGMFVEGFVELEAVETEDADLSIPYMGFYGEWDKAPIFDKMYALEGPDGGAFYKDTKTVAYYTNGWSNTESSGFGYVNDEGKVAYVYNKDYTTLSKTQPNVGVTVNTLRNLRTFKITILDENDEIVKEMEAEDQFVRKTYYNTNASTPTLTRTSFGAWDGTGKKGTKVPEGKYKFILSGKVDYEGAEYQEQTIELPVTVDYSAPVIQAKYDPEFKLLKLKITDGGYISLLNIQDVRGDNTYWSTGEFWKEPKDGVCEISVNLDEFGASAEDKINILAVDIGKNMGTKIIDLVNIAQNANVTINHVYSSKDAEGNVVEDGRFTEVDDYPVVGEEYTPILRKIYNDTEYVLYPADQEISIIVDEDETLNNITINYMKKTPKENTKPAIGSELNAILPFDGVAPEAQVIGLKVFSDNGGGAKTSNTLAAVEDAILLGADSVNLSLGSPSGFTEYSKTYGMDYTPYEYEGPFRRARDLGIVIAASAGNDGRVNGGSYGQWSQYGVTTYPFASNPDTSYLGSPSSKNSATSIASANNNYEYLQTITLKSGGKNTELTFYDFNYLLSLPGFMQEMVLGTYKYVFLESFADGEDYYGNPIVNANFDEKDVKGKIAVFRKFGNSDDPFDAQYYGLASKAKLKGAVGVLFANNVPGEFVAIAGEASFFGVDTAGIPVAFLSQENGDILEKDNEKGKLSIDGEYKNIKTNDNIISDFSSWGVTPDLKLKPEITAPGGNIYSSVFYEDNPEMKYEVMSGTSMSSPQIAGAMAIASEYFEKTSEFSSLEKAEKSRAIENLLMSTANVMKNKIGIPYSPRRQGAGIVDLEGLVTSKVYLENAKSLKTKVELGDGIDKEFDVEFKIVNKGSEDV